MNDERRCADCDKATPDGSNYCNWGCVINRARRNGGRVIAPNGLPIMCVRADNTMLEHEHADHPHYRFPVTAGYVGKSVDVPEWDCSFKPQTHALIYADGYVALTLYECRYSIWSVTDGLSLGGFAGRGEWRLAEDGLSKIREVTSSRSRDAV